MRDPTRRNAKLFYKQMTTNAVSMEKRLCERNERHSQGVGRKQGGGVIKGRNLPDKQMGRH